MSSGEKKFGGDAFLPEKPGGERVARRGRISAGLRGILSKIGVSSETDAAIDAAREEGFAPPEQSKENISSKEDLSK